MPLLSTNYEILNLSHISSPFYFAKYYYKIRPGQAYYGYVQTSGHILMTGWWGVARHFNYFGEIVQALALALPGFLATGVLCVCVCGGVGGWMGGLDGWVSVKCLILLSG